MELALQNASTRPSRGVGNSFLVSYGPEKGSKIGGEARSHRAPRVPSSEQGGQARWFASGWIISICGSIRSAVGSMPCPAARIRVTGSTICAWPRSKRRCRSCPPSSSAVYAPSCARNPERIERGFRIICAAVGRWCRRARGGPTPTSRPCPRCGPRRYRRRGPGRRAGCQPASP